jgi:hypothetical protein
LDCRRYWTFENVGQPKQGTQNREQVKQQTDVNGLVLLQAKLRSTPQKHQLAGTKPSYGKW